MMIYDHILILLIVNENILGALSFILSELSHLGVIFDKIPKNRESFWVNREQNDDFKGILSEF
jgi:hypothetical protein